MENLTVQKKGRPVSALAATQSQIKAKDLDCIALIKSNGWYIAIEDDAVKVSETLGITLTKTQQGERQTAFPSDRLGIYLPKLIRAGHRIEITDIINQ